MPVELDAHDISILKSLFKDGRKSFRQISRETGISTPTVKARFERLVNIGFIQGVMPLIDFGKIDKTKTIHELSAANKIPLLKNIKKGTKIMLDCDYCHGVIAGAPQYLNLQTTNDSFAVYRANLNIKQNMVEEYKQS